MKFIKSENKKVKFVSYDKMVEDLNSRGIDIISSFNLENIYFEKEIMEDMKSIIEGLNVDVQNIIKDYFGIDRSSLMREIKNLKDEGFIETKGKNIRLLF